VVLLLAGGSAALFLTAPDLPSTTTSAPAPAAVMELQGVSAPAAPPAVHVPAGEEPPRGRVHAREKSLDDGSPAETQPQSPPVRRQQEEKVSSAAREPSERQPAQRAPAALPSGKLVSVHSIDCDAAGKSCSAEVDVDGRVAQVYAGDAWQGVEIQLILPDTVYVRQGGTVLALRSR
jgi:hypothetical protein